MVNIWELEEGWVVGVRLKYSMAEDDEVQCQPINQSALHHHRPSHEHTHTQRPTTSTPLTSSSSGAQHPASPSAPPTNSLNNSSAARSLPCPFLSNVSIPLVSAAAKRVSDSDSVVDGWNDSSSLMGCLEGDWLLPDRVTLMLGWLWGRERGGETCRSSEKGFILLLSNFVHGGWTPEAPAYLVVARTPTDD